MKDITGREYIYGLAQDKNGAPYLFNIGELVRCKDCRFYDESCEVCRCPQWDLSATTYPNVLADDYCAYAERRKNNE